MQAPAMMSLNSGRFRLVIGDEASIVAEEVTTPGDSTRLGVRDLSATWILLDQHGVPSDGYEVLHVATASDSEPETAPKPEIQAGIGPVEVHGDEEAPLVRGVRGLDRKAHTAILAEATAAAWRQRLSDAADTASPLTSADDAVLGPLAMAGTPSMTQLRAERRRRLASWNPNAVSAGDGQNTTTQTVLETVISDLRMQVRYGASAFADNTPERVAESLAAATIDGGWVSATRILLAAEESYAIVLLLAAREQLMSSDMGDGGAAWVLERVDRDRREFEELAVILTAALARVPATPQRAVHRLLRRTQVQNTRDFSEAINSFVSAVHPPQRRKSAWNDVADVLAAADSLDRQVLSEVSLWDGDDGEDVQTFEEVAALLGELFALQLAAARERVDLLKTLHPGEAPEDLVKRVKRQSIADLGRATATDGQEQPVLAKVAMLAMEIALLRGVEPHSEAEFKELGRRLLARAAVVIKVQSAADENVPLVFMSLGVLVRKIQPFLIEALFNAMSHAKPARPGVARDAFKSARSNVWRSRHNQAVGDAAATRLGEALLLAVDGGSARLLVRLVDKSLTAPKRNG